MIYGVATNDLNYVTQRTEYYKDEFGKKRRRVVWQCPYYQRWFAMLTRCYKESELAKHPTYENKYVCDDWLTFSNFKRWMENQDWEGKQLDKDILFEGNTVYSPDTCVFISQELNKFLLEKSKVRELPIGVSYNKTKRKYIAQSAGVQLGGFDDVKSAALAWANYKLRQAVDLAKEQTETVAKALVLRYTRKLELTMEKCFDKGSC